MMCDVSACLPAIDAWPTMRLCAYIQRLQWQLSGIHSSEVDGILHFGFVRLRSSQEAEQHVSKQSAVVCCVAERIKVHRSKSGKFSGGSDMLFAYLVLPDGKPAKHACNHQRGTVDDMPFCVSLCQTLID